MTHETKINLIVGIVVVLSVIVFVSIQMKDSLASIVDQFDTKCSVEKIENCSIEEAHAMVYEMVDELNLKSDKTYHILEK
jgi:hypothetical protein